MTAKKTIVQKITTYINRSLNSFKKQYNADFDADIWYNADEELTEADVAKLKAYANKKNADLVFIISGAKEYIRPQRTMGSYPEEFYTFQGNNQDSSFVYMSWRKAADHDETDEEFKARCKEARKELATHDWPEEYTQDHLDKLFHLNTKYTDRSDDLHSRQKLVEAITRYGTEPEIKLFTIIDTITKENNRD